MKSFLMRLGLPIFCIMLLSVSSARAQNLNDKNQENNKIALAAQADASSLSNAVLPLGACAVGLVGILFARARAS